MKFEFYMETRFGLSPISHLTLITVILLYIVIFPIVIFTFIYNLTACPFVAALSI